MKLKSFTHFVHFLTACLVFLNSCSPSSNTQGQNSILEITSTIPPAETNTQLPQSSTPKISTPTQVNWPSRAITSENAENISEVNHWGRGNVLRIQKMQKNDKFLVQTPLGVYFYQSDPPFLLHFFPKAINFVLSSNENWLVINLRRENVVEIWDMNKLSLYQTIIHDFPDEIVSKIESEIISPIYISEISISPDNSQIAIGYLDGVVELWRIGEKAPFVSLTHDYFQLTDGDISIFFNIQFSPDGKVLVVFKLPGIWRSNRITFWSIPDGKLIAFSRQGRYFKIADPSILPDKKTLLVQALNSSIIELGLWDIQTGSEISRINTELTEINLLEISPEGNQLIIYGVSVDDGYIRQVRELPKGNLLENEKVAVLPQDIELIRINEFLHIQGHYENIWDERGDFRFAKIGVIGERVFRILGQSDWLTFPEGVIEPLNLPEDAINPYFNFREQSIRWCQKDAIYFQNKNLEVVKLDLPSLPKCDGMTVSPKKTYAAVWQGNSLSLVNLETGNINDLRLHKRQILSANFTSNEDVFISGGSCEFISWLVNPPQKIAVGNVIGCPSVRKIIVSKDNSFAVTLRTGENPTDTSSQILIWRIQDAFILNRINPPFIETRKPKLISFTLSPDDKLIASGDDYGYVRIWNVKSGDELVSFKFDYDVLDLAFTDNGSGLIIVLGDGTYRLWGIP